MLEKKMSRLTSELHIQYTFVIFGHQIKNKTLSIELNINCSFLLLLLSFLYLDTAFCSLKFPIEE